MEKVIIPVEYFLSAKYNQTYIGEMCMPFLTKYKWQTVPDHHKEKPTLFL